VFVLIGVGTRKRIIVFEKVIFFLNFIFFFARSFWNFKRPAVQKPSRRHCAEW